jgi:hypothetical protein
MNGDAQHDRILRINISDLVTGRREDEDYQRRQGCSQAKAEIPETYKAFLATNDQVTSLFYSNLPVF